MPLLVAKDKTGQRWEPGHQPLLQKQMAEHLEEFHISTLNLFPMAKNVKNSIDRE